MNFRYLDTQEIGELAQAAVQAGLASNAARNVLMAALNQGYALGLNPDVGTPLLQVNYDLNEMNRVPRLADGSVPLLDWLRQAGMLARQQSRPQAETFTKYESKVEAKASGRPPLPAPETLREVISQEAIVHQDDMLDFWFLSGGALAGNSVAKLMVPLYENEAPLAENGRPRLYLGTGWLVTSQLLVTNHHVINARVQGEQVGDADLRIQGANAVAKFDFNTVDDPGEDAQIGRLEAWDRDLDYAVLRLRAPLARRPLRLRTQPVVLSPGTYMPVNIIQHPAGHFKRVALRNNLVTDADGGTLRYFTDTLSGSSGSPVFDDAWRVVALHRGSQAIAGVSFQGRSAAVVNVGTQIAALLDHLGQRNPALRQEIESG